MRTGTIISSMANELLDTTGARIEWLRKRQRMTQRGLAHRVGVGNVYISQLESGTRNASRALIALLANELGTSRAFLELDTDDPASPQATQEPAPVYFSPEADAAAQLIDAMPPARPRKSVRTHRAHDAALSGVQAGQANERA